MSVILYMNKGKYYLTLGGKFYYISWDIAIFGGKKSWELKFLEDFSLSAAKTGGHVNVIQADRVILVQIYGAPTVCHGLNQVLHKLYVSSLSPSCHHWHVSQCYKSGSRLGRSQDLLKVTQWDPNPVMSGCKVPALSRVLFASSTFAVWPAFRILKLSGQGVSFWKGPYF